MLDYDGDGRSISTSPRPATFPSTLRPRPRGTSSTATAATGRSKTSPSEAGVGFHGFCHGVAVGDVDNNGTTTSYLCNYGSNVLYLNQGDGTFRTPEHFGAECGSWSTAAAFLDYDSDGWLDLYVSCYGHWAYHEPHHSAATKPRHCESTVRRP